VSDARALIDEDEDIFRLVDNSTICSAHALDWRSSPEKCNNSELHLTIAVVPPSWYAAPPPKHLDMDVPIHSFPSIPFG